MTKLLLIYKKLTRCTLPPPRLPVEVQVEAEDKGRRQTQVERPTRAAAAKRVLCQHYIEIDVLPASAHTLH